MIKDENPLKIEDALKHHAANKKKATASVTEETLSAKLFPQAQEKTQYVNIRNLIKGTTARVSVLAVKTICHETGVDANFLFGVEPMGKKRKI